MSPSLATYSEYPGSDRVNIMKGLWTLTSETECHPSEDSDVRAIGGRIATISCFSDEIEGIQRFEPQRIFVHFYRSSTP